jgi:hypothetical protein
VERIPAVVPAKKCYETQQTTNGYVIRIAGIRNEVYCRMSRYLLGGGRISSWLGHDVW